MKLELFGNRILADFWNKKVLGTLNKEEAASGAHIKVEKFPQGQMVSVRDSGMWAHPWFTSPKWNPDGGPSGRWECTVEPGFVNGEDPRVPAAEAEKTGCEKGGVIGLCDRPMVPFHSFKPVTTHIPKFFQALGVKEVKESNFIINTNTGTVSTNTTNMKESGPKERWLQQAQIFLTKARPTYQMQTTIPANLIAGQLIDYHVQYDMTALDALGPRARLLTSDAMPEAMAKPTALDRIQGNYGDDGLDRKLVATVYFLSPAGFAPPSDPKAKLPPPDEGWTPYVAHNLFWNLCHQAQNLPPVNMEQNPANPFFSAYLGQYTFIPTATAGIAAAQEQNVLAAIRNDTANEGYFWTI